MKINPDSNVVAQHIQKIIGGSPRSLRFKEPTKGTTLRIDAYEQRPWGGVTTYATVGLSSFPMCQDGKEFPVRAELLASAYGANDEVSFLLSEVSFHVMKSGWMCSPGSVLRDVVKKVGISSSLEHVYFNSPFLWDGELGSTLISGVTVAWLMLVPITEAEYQFYKQSGHEALEARFSAAEIDIFNLGRKSII